MLKMGLPLGAVQNSMTKDGKDPTIMTLDPDKSLSSQLKGQDTGPPLKDDPDYSKYFKVSSFSICFSIHELSSLTTNCIICLLCRCLKWDFQWVQYKMLCRRTERIQVSLH